ncbi:MAG: 3',5'-cyclic adenosine monophosphate phosphodiesterase CpdA [Pseudomonas delhiensis]|nr:MAG: 3',5'-cyclic adenosine monophosphate phosphodiesterase CpdA [Pseudomonas delhiensis]
MLIAQLSDPHVRPPGLLYQGLVDSNAMFAAAVEQVRQLRPRPDVVLISGDLVDDGADAAYAEVLRLLASLDMPLLMVPGNHDARVGFRQWLGERHAVPLPVEGPLHWVADTLGEVRLIGLDLCVEGEHHGEMSEAAVEWLEAVLRQAPERPTLLMMHFPPFISGIAYIDVYRCYRGERLAALLRRFPAVERVVCGHIHRHMSLRFGGTLLVTAPSTTTAIALRLAPYASEASYLEPPGLLLHEWRNGRGMLTHWLPVGNFTGPWPFA